MQHRMFNKFTLSLLFGLLATMTVSAAVGSNLRQQLPYYSMQLAAGSTNPWALPQAPEQTTDFQRPPQHPSHRYQEIQPGNIYPGFRFVTPQILESLKQQQMQTQQVPAYYPNSRYRPQSSMPPQTAPLQLMSEQPAAAYAMPGYSAMPFTGSGEMNPLYDAPAASPWGNSPDVMYRGESFPWVPDAAIGGIPPMNVLPFAENNGSGGAETGSLQNRNNAFNPFAFGPNGNL